MKDLGKILIVFAIILFVSSVWVEAYSNKLFITAAIFFIPGIVMCIFNYLEGVGG